MKVQEEFLVEYAKKLAVELLEDFLVELLENFPVKLLAVLLMCVISRGISGGISDILGGRPKLIYG